MYISIKNAQFFDALQHTKLDLETKQHFILNIIVDKTIILLNHNHLVFI